MLERSQDILRLSFAAAALLIGGSVAYHYAIYIPEKDQEAKAEIAAKEVADERREEQKKEEAAKSDEQRRTDYRICVSNALADYHSRWEASCRSISQAADKDRSNCVGRGLDQTTCESLNPVVPAENCRLPNALANSYEDDLQNEKQRCLAEANNGLAS
jgi:hypothetical protein